MDKERCMDMEELASRFLDGELEAGERERFLDCLDERAACRRLVKYYREQDRFLEAEAGLTPPPCPDLPSRGISLRSLLVPVLAAGLAVLLFAAGIFFGEDRALKGIPSFARVAAPEVWTAGGRGFNVAQEFVPLADLIGHYQVEIAGELDKARPDWDRIRALMVTLGSLRTDLELLSLHERYQKDPSSGASSWRRTLGMNDRESGSL